MNREATDPRNEELQAHHLQALKNARLELCKITDDPIRGVRPYYRSYWEIIDIIASIEKLLGVK